MVANGRTLFIAFVLGEDAAQIGLAGLGPAVGLLSFSTRQFLLAHGQAGAVAAGIKHRGATGFRGHGSFLPGLRGRADSLHQPLHLPGRDLDAAGFPQMFLRLFKARFVRALQADQAGQGRRVASFQAQGRIGRKMALSCLRIKIVVPLDFKGTEDPLGL